MSEQGEAKTSTGSETETSLVTSVPSAETKPVEGVPEVTPQPPKEGEPPAAPEALTVESFKVPEGMTADEPLMTEFLGIMNNAELDAKARGQALVDLQAKAMQAVSERGNKLWSDMQDDWVKQANTQFGEGLQPMLGNIAKALDEYGGTPEQVKELRDVFTLTGAGNHPAMIRFLDNLYKPLREGTARAGSPGGGERSAAERLYPNLPKGEL